MPTKTVREPFWTPHLVARGPRVTLHESERGLKGSFCWPLGMVPLFGGLLVLCLQPWPSLPSLLGAYFCVMAFYWLASRHTLTFDACDRTWDEHKSLLGITIGKSQGTLDDFTGVRVVRVLMRTHPEIAYWIVTLEPRMGGEVVDIYQCFRHSKAQHFARQSAEKLRLPLIE